MIARSSLHATWLVIETVPQSVPWRCASRLERSACFPLLFSFVFCNLPLMTDGTLSVYQGLFCPSNKPFVTSYRGCVHTSYKSWWSKGVPSWNLVTFRSEIGVICNNSLQFYKAINFLRLIFLPSTLSCPLPPSSILLSTPYARSIGCLIVICQANKWPHKVGQVFFRPHQTCFRKHQSIKGGRGVYAPRAPLYFSTLLILNFSLKFFY